jgi:F0F1-type ATP synthase assembly protein I
MGKSGKCPVLLLLLLLLAIVVVVVLVHRKAAVVANFGATNRTEHQHHPTGCFRLRWLQ